MMVMMMMTIWEDDDDDDDGGDGGDGGDDDDGGDDVWRVEYYGLDMIIMGKWQVMDGLGGWYGMAKGWTV